MNNLNKIPQVLQQQLCYSFTACPLTAVLTIRRVDLLSSLVLIRNHTKFNFFLASLHGYGDIQTVFCSIFSRLWMFRCQLRAVKQNPAAHHTPAANRSIRSPWRSRGEFLETKPDRAAYAAPTCSPNYNKGSLPRACYYYYVPGGLWADGLATHHPGSSGNPSQSPKIRPP